MARAVTPRRVVGWVGRGVLWLVLGLTLLVVLVLVGINLPPLRGVIVKQVNAALEPAFKGRISLESLGHVDLSGVQGANVKIFDPAGREVIDARDVGVHVRVPRLVWSLVAHGSDPLRIDVSRIGVKHIAITLIDDGNGSPTLAQAFEPRSPTSEPEEESGPPPTLIIEELALARTEVRGALKSPGPVDADLIGLKARLENDVAGLRLALSELELAVRRVPSVERVSGRLRADVFIPATPKAPRAVPEQPKSGPSSATLALHPAAPRRIDASFDGTIFDSPAGAKAELVGEELKVAFDAARLSPALVAKLAPGLVPKAPLSASANAQGKLSDLSFEAVLEQAAARIRASGRLQGDNDKRLDARLEGRNIDLANLMPGGANTRLNVAASTELTLAESGMNGSYRVVSEGSRFDDQGLPEARIEGNLKAPQGGDTTTTGKLTIAEPGAATTLEYRVLARRDGVLAHATLESKLEGSARLQALSGVRATGKINADVDYDGPAERIEANAEVDLEGVDHPSFKARRVTAALYASGLVAAPTLKLASNLKGVSAGGRTFSDVRLSATGSLAQLAVQARLKGKKPERIELRAVVAANEQRVDAVEVTLSDPAESSGPLRLTAQSVHWGKKIRAEGVSLDGPGHARAELVYGQGLESLELESERLDPLRIARMLGLTTLKGGVELSLNANVKSRARMPSGKVTGQIANVNFGQLRGAHANIDLELLRGKLSGQALFDLGRGGKTELVVKEFKLPTGAANTGALERVSGELALKGELELAQFQQLLPFGGVERAEGRITFDIARQEPNEKDERSRWSAHLESERLLLVQERKPVQQPPSATAEQAERAEPFALRGIDIKLDAELGSPGAKLAGSLKDAKGELVSVDGELAQVHSVAELMRSLKAMQTTQFKAKLHVPKRALEQLPAPIRPAEVQGTLALEVDAAGTLAAPRVDVRASLGSFGAKRERARRKRGLQIELSARYERPGGKLELSADRQERTVLDLKSRWAGDLRDLGKWTPGQPSPVRANLNLALSQFPLAVIPELQNRNIRGTVSGKGTLEQFGKDARFALDLTTEQLRIEKLQLDKLQASVEASNGRLLARTLLDGRGGKANGEISTNVTWGDRVVPVLDPALEGSFKSEGLRLSALEPLLSGIVSELDGFVDVDMRAQMQNGKPELSGDVKLREGVIQLPSIGQRFDKVEAHVAIQPGHMVMDELHALGITGAFDAKAEAKLDGLAPTSANMSLSIKENRKLPLTIEGEAVGDGWGTIEAKFQRDEAEKANKIEIDLKKFYIQLPNTPPGGVQNLAPADHISIGFRRKDGEFVAVPLQPVKKPPEPSEWKTVVVVDINSLWVEKGDQAKLGLAGRVEATMGETLDVRGKIETRRGKIDISGKLFDIERGTVSFTGGEPSNPIINAVARYEAPDGYTVFAEYTGTASKGSLRLSSEPPLSQDEILTLLLFGSPDGSFGTGNESNGIATAVSVAGGTAAQGLNRAMSDLTNLDVQARVDTSTGSPRPELVVQLSARVAARVTQALGEPSPGQSPDRTFLTVELRFASAWSVSTMIGDKGASALDLIWRKRY